MNNKLPLVAVLATLIVLASLTGVMADDDDWEDEWDWDEDDYDDDDDEEDTDDDDDDEWDNNSISDKPNVDIDDDDNLEDIFFEELIENRAGLTEGMAIYKINNIFDTSIPLTTDFYETTDNEVKTLSYYTKETESYQVEVPIYETTKECTTAANGTWCWEDTIVVGTKTETETREVWKEIEKIDNTIKIPANFHGLIKIVGKYENKAYNNPVKVDWVPKICIDKGFWDFGGTCYAQEEWAWWNSTWNKRKFWNLTATNNTDASDELISFYLWNDSDISGSAGYPDAVRFVHSDNELPYSLFNYSNATSLGAYLIHDINNSAPTSIEVYYEYAGAAQPNYADCTSWTPCWEDSTNKSFFVLADNFEDGDVSDWTSEAGISHSVVDNQSTIGKYSLWSSGDGDELGTYILIEENNLSRFYSAYRYLILDDGVRTNMNYGDGAAFSDVANIRYRYDQNQITNYNAGFQKLNQSNPNDWQTVSFECRISGGQTCNASQQNATHGHFKNTSLDMVRGSPTLIDRISIDDPVSPLKHQFYLSEIFISSVNEFELRPEPSTYTISGEQNLAVLKEINFNKSQFAPPNNTEYGSGTQWTVWFEVCNISNGEWQDVNMSFNGSASTAITNITNINASCDNFTANFGELPAGTYPANATVTDNNSHINSQVGSFTVAKNTSNTVTVNIAPSTSVTLGTSTTATCSDTVGGSLSMTRNGIGVSNPHTATLGVGTHTYNCTSDAGSNYTVKSGSSVLTVGQNVTSGCFNNTTYAFKSNVNVTHNITVIDFLAQRDAYNARSDLQDVTVTGQNATIIEVNGSRWVVANTTDLIGLNITFQWGNFLNSLGHTANLASTANDTNNLSFIDSDAETLLLIFKDEVNQSELFPPDANITLNFQCVDGSSIATIFNGSNETRFRASTFSSWRKASAKVTYSAADFYTRRITVSDSSAERTIWLVDAQEISVLEVVNELFDLTANEFANSNLTVKKFIGGNLETIDQQFFDVTKRTVFYGIDGDEYQYVIANNDEQRTLGNIIINPASVFNRLVVRAIDQYDGEREGELLYNFEYSNTTGVLKFTYFDPYNNTTEINLTVVYFDNRSQINFQQSLNTPSVTFTYNVPHTNASYEAIVNVNHKVAIGTTSWAFSFGQVFAIFASFAAGIGVLWGKIVGLGVYFITVLSVGKRQAAFGALMGGFVLAFMSATNILPLHPMVLGIYFLITIVWIWRRGTKDAL